MIFLFEDLLIFNAALFFLEPEQIVYHGNLSFGPHRHIKNKKFHDQASSLFATLCDELTAEGKIYRDILPTVM